MSITHAPHHVASWIGPGATACMHACIKALQSHASSLLAAACAMLLAHAQNEVVRLLRGHGKEITRMNSNRRAGGAGGGGPCAVVEPPPEPPVTIFDDDDGCLPMPPGPGHLGMLGMLGRSGMGMGMGFGMGMPMSPAALVMMGMGMGLTSRHLQASPSSRSALPGLPLGLSLSPSGALSADMLAGLDDALPCMGLLDSGTGEMAWGGADGGAMGLGRTHSACVSSAGHGAGAGAGEGTPWSGLAHLGALGVRPDELEVAYLPAAEEVGYTRTHACTHVCT